MSPEKKGGIQPENPRKKTGFKEVALGLALAAGLGAATQSEKVGVKKASAEDGNKDEVVEKSKAEVKSENDMKWQGSKYTVEPGEHEAQENKLKEKLANSDEVFEKIRGFLSEKGFELEPREDKDGKIICDLYSSSDPSTGEKKLLAEILFNQNGTMVVGKMNEFDKAATVDSQDELFKKIDEKFWFTNEVELYKKTGNLAPLQEYVADKELDVNIPRNYQTVTDKQISQEDLKKMRDKMFESDVGDSNKAN